LIVDSAPGPIRAKFLFDSERPMVRAVLGDRVKVLPDPTVDQLARAVRKDSPALIHLAGVDSHQGTRLLGQPDPGLDGYILANDRGQPEAVEAQTFAEHLTTSRTQPQLVACNFQASAARVAAMAVAKGAAAAIGFQDGVDDALAEAFYARFYVNWQAMHWHTVDAFVRTLDELRSRPGILAGLGIVLWTDHDILPEVASEGIADDRAIWTAPSTAARPARSPEAVPIAGAVVVATTTTTGDSPDPDADGAGVASVTTVAGVVPDTPPEPGALDARWGYGSSQRQRLIPGEVSPVSEPQPLDAEVQVREVVSLVRLHNRKPLFDTFRIRKSGPDDVADVQTEVTLDLGRHAFPYKATRILSQPVTELRDDIHLPLTSDLLRSVHEAIQSVVYVRVRHAGVVVHENTLPVRIVSADEWTDTDTETRWLPSFVLPSDPVVDAIRRSALPALRTFADRATEGFYGYQVVEGAGLAGLERVDHQVSAIWTTLAFQYDLSYINPPPGYSERSQRLRTPSEVVAGRAGPCIDLALLFAACLEAIDLYPVILMYEGHANVGYWRSPAAHKDFVTLAEPTPIQRVGHEVQADAWEVQSDARPAAQAPGADLRRDADPNTAEIRRRVDRQELRVLETTLLCERAGFGDAIRGAGDTFEVRRFRSLLDVRLARQANVTPLPLRFD